MTPRWRRVATGVLAVEVAAVVVAVLSNALIPTLVILALATVSLFARHEQVSTLGFHRVARPWRLVWQMAAVALLLTLFHQALFIPLLTRATGQEQDFSDFTDLEGNLALLAIFVVLTWTLAALGEEIAYRGYLLTRLTQLLGASGAGLVVSILFSSVLFGWAHTEQGALGVLLAAFDGAVFCVLRYRCNTLWAAILAHGFSNTLGMIAFYLVGPISGFW